jgi:hypothetical protein
MRTRRVKIGALMRSNVRSGGHAGAGGKDKSSGAENDFHDMILSRTNRGGNSRRRKIRRKVNRAANYPIIAG